MRKTVILATMLMLSIATAIGQTGYYIPSERFSSGIVNDLCQDRQGYMWVATDYGLNKFDGYRFTTYLHQTDDSTSISSNIVVSLFSEPDGELWVGTSQGLDRYDYATGRFIHLPFVNGAQPRVTKIRRTDDGRLVVCTSGFSGLYYLEGDSLCYWPDGSAGMNFLNSILFDRQGRLWQCGYDKEFVMRDGQGIHRMTSTQGFVVDFVQHGDEVLVVCLHGIHSYRNGQLTEADLDLGVMNRDVVFRCAYTDSQGNIYIGSRGDGLFRLARDSRRLERVEVIRDDIDLNTAKVWAIAEDRLGNIWLGCQSKGLLMLQKQPPQFKAWSFPAQGVKISSTVTSLCEGDKGTVWCTVQGNGVFGFDSLGHIVARPAAPAAAECIYREKRADGQGSRYWIGTGNALYAYDPLTGQSQQQFSFDCDKLDIITDDGKGHLYISAFSKGFFRYDPATRETRHFTSGQKDDKRGWLCNDWVMAMMPDREGRLWLATSSGLSCYDPRTDSFRPFGWHELLTRTLCFSLCETSQGDILVGTENGLYVYHPGEQEAQPFGNGLLDKVVGYVVEAPNGDLWCATSMGIWQWDAAGQRFIGHVNGNGLQAKEYISGVGLSDSNGKVYFAYNEGLTVFRPSEVTGSHSELPPVCLTGFYVGGNAMNPQADHFSVSYLDNTISLEFSLLDYNNPANIIYEYSINGGPWRQNPEGQNAVQLTHLQPGTYQMDVRALSSGVHSATTTLTVEVTPPWYRSTVAYTIYFLGLMGLIGFMGFTYRRRANRQLDEEKMKFLINATHDIRSPLTLIMGAISKLKNLKLEELKSEKELQSLNSSVLQPSVDTIDRNAQRLLLLVNQILDERRIDKKQMQLHCRETNLVSFVSAICKLYQFGATQRGITFTFEHDKEYVLAWVDRINFDKVVSNLLSNAFKYTYDGGEVKVVLRETEKTVELQVIDNGVGIKEQDPDRLFDRFYQGQHSDDLGLQGTGIGLNLCRAITQMHGGSVKAANRSDARGACFTVTLPKGNKHLKPEQIVADSPSREIHAEGGSYPRSQFRILIVDDDPEMADYITGELGTYYKFDYAPDGREALKTLLTDRRYDLVVSDVMMPHMDGITLLRHIKENPQISQLPVVMLTSKAAVEHKLEGLKSGADAYIAKPFDMEELHIQIDNLIAGMRRLRGKFSGAVSQEQRVEPIEVKGYDDALMDRVMRSVNANLSNPNFTVDTLATDVGISRAQLHRKMKEITGIPTGKFLRNLRMEQAARLLREGKVNVAQVSDCVGYVDQAHFATAFKAHFGMAPSEYAENQKAKNNSSKDPKPSS